jgi:hypothetical protein
MDTTETATEEKVKETVLVGWKAPEYEDYERDIAYYAPLGALFLAIIGYAAYIQDWFIAVTFVILGVFLAWYQRKSPKMKTYRITQLGIYEDNKFYQYNEIYSYWFIITDRYRSLNIIFAKKYLPQLTILLDKTDPVKIRSVLSKHIPEEGSRTETMLDRLVRLFRL